MPLPCGHEPPRPEKCRLCWLAGNDGRYQRACALPVTASETPKTGGPGTERPPEPGPAVVGPPPEPCDHQGFAVSGAKLVELGLDPRKNWLYCDHPEKPRGAIVCPCQGCRPDCPGYELEPESQ